MVFLCQARNVRQNRARCHLHPCLHRSVQTLQFSDCAICRHQEKKVRPLPKFGEHKKSTPRSERCAHLSSRVQVCHESRDCRCWGHPFQEKGHSTLHIVTASAPSSALASLRRAHQTPFFPHVSAAAPRLKPNCIRHCCSSLRRQQSPLGKALVHMVHDVAWPVSTSCLKCSLSELSAAILHICTFPVSSDSNL